MLTAVTGGAGFIGSHIAEGLIQAGHSVRVLDNLSTGYRENVPGEAELVVGDITDADAVEAALGEPRWSSMRRPTGRCSGPSSIPSRPTGRTPTGP